MEMTKKERLEHTQSLLKANDITRLYASMNKKSQKPKTFIEKHQIIKMMCEYLECDKNSSRYYDIKKFVHNYKFSPRLKQFPLSGGNLNKNDKRNGGKKNG